jgi:hypothetical protein
MSHPSGSNRRSCRQRDPDERPRDIELDRPGEVLVRKNIPRRCVERGLSQQVQPATDRTDQRIFLGLLDPRRIFQRLQQHSCRVLAVPSDWAAAPPESETGSDCPISTKTWYGSAAIP